MLYEILALFFCINLQLSLLDIRDNKGTRTGSVDKKQTAWLFFFGGS